MSKQLSLAVALMAAFSSLFAQTFSSIYEDYNYFEGITATSVSGGYKLFVPGNQNPNPSMNVLNINATGSLTTASTYNLTYTGSVRSFPSSDGKYLVSGITANNKVALKKLNADGSVVWSRTYIMPVTGGIPIGYYHKLAQNQSGQIFLALAFSMTSQNETQLALYKLSATGTLIWSRAVQPANQATFTCTASEVLPSTAGGCILKWDNNYLSSEGVANFNNNGTELCNLNLSSITGTLPLVMSGASNSFVVLLGHESGIAPIMQKFTSTGSLVWSKYFNSLQYLLEGCYAMSGRILSDNSIVVCGNGSAYNGSRLYMFKFNSSGVLQWKNLNFGFAALPQQLSVMSDGGFLICGTQDLKPWLMRTDNKGNISYNNLPDIAVSDIVMPASGVVGTVVNFTFDLENRSSVAVTGDYQVGVYLSYDPYFSPETDALVGWVNTGNTPPGIIQNVPAAIAVPSQYVGFKQFLFFYCDNGNVIPEANEPNNVPWYTTFTPAAALTYQETDDLMAQPQANMASKFTVYPNPANSNGYVTIGMPELANKQVVVRLFGMDGRMLLSEKREVEGSSVQVTLPSLTTGMYSLIIRSEDGQVLSERLMIK